MSNLTLDAGRIHFELNSPLGLAVWGGEVVEGVIDAEFSQGGMVAEFWMQRFEDPDEDGDGASFRREEVVFSNGDITLAGELVLPDGDGPHSAAVLISGSGEQDRDSDFGGFRAFRALAESSVPTYTIATILSANHLFQEAVTGSINEYARLKRQFHPEFLEIPTTWLTSLTGEWRR